MGPSFIHRCTSNRAGRQIRPNSTSEPNGRRTTAINHVMGIPSMRYLSRILLLALLVVTGIQPHAQATANQSGVFNFQAFTSTGAPAANYRLYTYIGGTTTHKTAYTDAAGSVAHTYTSDGAGGQYIALDARGELPAPLYLTLGAYDIVLKTNTGSTVWTRRTDNIPSTSPILNGLGSAGAPSYSFAGDSNTGEWSPAADTLAWSLAGTETMRLNSTGLGIGTTASGFKLDLGTTGAGAIGGVGNIGGYSDSGAYTIWGGRTTANGGYVALYGGSHATLPNVILFATSTIERLRITSDGRIYGTALHNNAGAVTGTATQYIASGTYTPTLTNTTNVAASSAGQPLQWMRVGNVVTVSGILTIQPTAAASTLTELRISLPIASTLGTGSVAGTGGRSGATVMGIVGGVTTTNVATFVFLAADTASTTYFVHFTYEVK